MPEVTHWCSINKFELFYNLCFTEYIIVNILAVVNLRLDFTQVLLIRIELEQQISHYLESMLSSFLKYDIL